MAQTERRVEVTTDASYNANASGTAIRGEATVQYTPVPISLTAGSGILNLNYVNGALGFGTGRIDFRTNIGENWNLFARTALAAFPGTDSTSPQYFNALNLGLTYAIIPDDGRKVFRVGLLETGKTVEVPAGSVLDQLYDSLSAGAAFGYRNLTAYTVGKFVLSMRNPTNQYWTAMIQPWPEELRVGARVELEKGNQVGAELDVSNFERGGKLVFNLATLPLPAQVALTFRNTSKTFGGATEIGTVVAVKLSRARISAAIEAGGVSLSKGETYDTKRLSSGAVAQYLYGTGSITASEMVHRLYPQAKIIGTSSVMVGGTPQLVVNYLLNGTRHTYAVGTREAMLADSSAELGPKAFGVLQDLMSSGSLDDFAKKYAERSIDDKIYAAATIAQAAHAGYDYVLEYASPFSTLRQRLAQLDPDTEFSRLQKSLLGGKTLHMGICVNIDGLAAAFLRRAGVEAYTFIVGSGDGLHAVAGAVSPDGKTGYAISYGQVFRAQDGGVWPAIQAYSRANGIILMGSLVFGDKNRLVGYYKGPEGRLMEGIQESGDDPFIDSLTRRRRR